MEKMKWCIGGFSLQSERISTDGIEKFAPRMATCAQNYGIIVILRYLMLKSIKSKRNVECSFIFGQKENIDICVVPT